MRSESYTLLKERGEELRTQIGLCWSGQGYVLRLWGLWLSSSRFLARFTIAGMNSLLEKALCPITSVDCLHMSVPPLHHWRHLALLVIILQRLYSRVWWFSFSPLQFAQHLPRLWELVLWGGGGDFQFSTSLVLPSHVTKVYDVLSNRFYFEVLKGNQGLYC